MPLALLFHYLMLNMFRMLIHPSSGASDLFVELFHGLYCSGTMCWCYVVVWLGWCGIRMRAKITHKSQAPEDGCINIRNMFSMK